MTDISDRLRAHMGKADIADVLPDCREAAAIIDALVKALEEITRGPESLSRGIAAEALRAVVGCPSSSEGQ